MLRWSIIPALLVVSTGFSQIYFGNRGGVSVGKQVLNGGAPLRTGTDYGSELIGGHAAATLELPLTDRSGLQLELGYVEKGYRAGKYSFFGETVPEQLFRLGYADLSLFYKWSALSGGMRPEVFIGPVIGRTLRLRDESATGAFVFEDPSDAQQFYSGENRAVDHLAPWEISAVAGAGFILQPGVARIHINYRYMYGLTSMYRYPVEYADVNGARITSGNQFNRTHLFTIGWSIPLSREAWDETPSGP